MTIYTEAIETYFKKANNISGEMDDVVSDLEELNARADWYSKGNLIWVEDEQKVYKAYTRTKTISINKQ